MNSKIALIFIALIGAGLFALPQTVALFAGQHSFVNIDATGNQIDCVKCHGDVQAELLNSGVDAPHDEFTCSMCHRIEAGKSSGDSVIYTMNYANGTAKRTVAMSETDFEAGRFPVSIPNTGTVTITGALAFAVSNSNEPATITTLTAAPGGHGPSSPVPVELLNADGTPKDTNPNTMYTGVRLSKVDKVLGWTYNGTAQPVLNLTGLGSEVVNPGGSYHAASLVGCMECHGGDAPPGHEEGDLADCSNCHYGGGSKLGQQMRNLQAGGFGLTNMLGDTGDKEAHMAWMNTSNGLSKNGNDACVACHTHVAVDITYTKPTIMIFDAIQDSNGNYTTGVVTTGGNTYTYSDGR